MHKLFQKLGARNAPNAVLLAFAQGLLPRKDEA
jgi:hypothetical protein